MHQGGCERWRRVGAEQEAAQVFCVSATDTQSARFTNSAWARFWALGLNGHRRYQSKPRRLQQDFHEPPWLTLIYENGGKVQEKHKKKD